MLKLKARQFSLVRNAQSFQLTKCGADEPSWCCLPDNTCVQVDSIAECNALGGSPTPIQNCGGACGCCIGGWPATAIMTFTGVMPSPGGEPDECTCVGFCHDPNGTHILPLQSVGGGDHPSYTVNYESTCGVPGGETRTATSLSASIECRIINIGGLVRYQLVVNMSAFATVYFPGALWDGVTLPTPCGSGVDIDGLHPFCFAQAFGTQTRTFTQVPDCSGHTFTFSFSTEDPRYCRTLPGVAPACQWQSYSFEVTI